MTLEMTKNSYTKSKLTICMVIATILLTGTLTTIPSAYSLTILFQDDYSSNVGWTQVGTDVTVDSPAFPGIAKFDNARDGGGVNEKRVFKQLPSTLPADNWTVEFEYSFTASTIPGHFPFALSATSADITFQSASDRVLVRHGGGSLNQMQLGGGGAALPGAIPISANTQYYVTLERVPTQLILGVFSDPARTIHITNSPFIQTIAVTDYTNINFIQHTIGLTGGSARTLTAEIDNTVIFTDVQQNQVTEIEIDIKPGSFPSSVDCTEKQPVPVAVFGSEGFDVSTIDLSSLELNGFPVTEVHDKIHIEDKNKDGIPDAVLHLDRSQVCEATLDAPLKESVDVTLTGSTTGGEAFEGIGDIRITGR